MKLSILKFLNCPQFYLFKKTFLIKTQMAFEGERVYYTDQKLVVDQNGG
jgi:hypothetical protein